MSFMSLSQYEGLESLDSELIDLLSGQLSNVTTWHVEIMDRKGRWIAEPKRWMRKAPSYSSHEEAVQGAVNAWRRTDRPARPAKSLSFQLDALEKVRS